MFLQKLLITEKAIKYYRIMLFTAILIFTMEMEGKEKKHLCLLHVLFPMKMVTEVKERVEVFVCVTSY